MVKLLLRGMLNFGLYSRSFSLRFMLVFGFCFLVYIVRNHLYTNRNNRNRRNNLRNAPAAAVADGVAAVAPAAAVPPAAAAPIAEAAAEAAPADAVRDIQGEERQAEENNDDAQQPPVQEVLVFSDIYFASFHVLFLNFRNDKLLFQFFSIGVTESMALFRHRHHNILFVFGATTASCKLGRLISVARFRHCDPLKGIDLINVFALSEKWVYLRESSYF